MSGDPQAEFDFSSLIAACGTLLQRVQGIARNADLSDTWEKDVRRAAQHVELALQSLDTSQSGDHPSLPGGLRRLVSNLTSRIMGEEDEDPAKAVSDEGGPDPNFTGLDGFHGYSWAISPPELLGFLRTQGKSGLLQVTTEDEVISVELQNGDVIQASSDNSPADMRLGEILVSRGYIGREDLTLFLALSAEDGRIGETMESEMLVTEEQLRDALEFQTQQLFHRLFRTQNAYFCFREGAAFEQRPRIRLNVTQLLLESARIQDESRAA